MSNTEGRIGDDCATATITNREFILPIIIQAAFFISAAYCVFTFQNYAFSKMLGKWPGVLLAGAITIASLTGSILHNMTGMKSLLLISVPLAGFLGITRVLETNSWLTLAVSTLAVISYGTSYIFDPKFIDNFKSIYK